MNKFIDLTHEVSVMQFQKHESLSAKAWIASDISELEWVVPIDKRALQEIDRMIKSINAYSVTMFLRTPDEFHIPHLRSIYREIKRRLDKGNGFAVIDCLPIEEYPIGDIISVFWVLGQLLGPNVAQKWDGTMIYDVMDTKQTFGYGVRGSATNVELVFHNDNAFGVRVPDHVGLLCEHPAKEGGLSRFCSLYSVHQRLLENYPILLKRLYQPMLFDRQAEHAPGAPRVALAPFFSMHKNSLNCRANSSLVRKGYQISKKKMDETLMRALHAIDEITMAPDLWVEAPLKRGQVQYLNNRELGHYRSQFVDHEDPVKKRHLYRLWHRSEGNSSYDG